MDATREWLLKVMKPCFNGDLFAKLELTEGVVRHDVMIEKSLVGRLIGRGGSIFKALVARTGCEIFVLDKEGPPPGCAPHMRLVILMGSEMATGCAAAEIEDLMKDDRRTKGADWTKHPLPHRTTNSLYLAQPHGHYPPPAPLGAPAAGHGYCGWGSQHGGGFAPPAYGGGSSGGGGLGHPLLEEWKDAKRRRDFVTSDRLRAQMKGEGFNPELHYNGGGGGGGSDDASKRPRLA